MLTTIIKYCPFYCSIFKNVHNKNFLKISKHIFISNRKLGFREMKGSCLLLVQLVSGRLKT